jgi:hypothetical protein
MYSMNSIKKLSLLNSTFSTLRLIFLKKNCTKIIYDGNLMIIQDFIDYSIAVVPHNDHFVHPIYGIKLRTITEGLQNEKWYLYFWK